MEWYYILLICIALFIVLSGTLFSLFYTFKIAKMVYFNQLVKKDGDTWGRVCSCTTNEEQVEMWNRGIAWAKAEEKYIKEVEIVSDNLKLVGQFFDFGFNKCVIILPGRCECLMYSYYYSAPYKSSGYNVLVIDSRGHGLSEGKYSTCGILESRDVLVWAKLLHDSYHQDKIIFHSICIGGASSILALTSSSCPSYINRFITDGLFINFKDTFGRHMKKEGHHLFPVFYEIWFWFKKYTSVSINESNPYKYIDKVKVPVLFLFGKQDTFSIPSNAIKLFDKCQSIDKELVWFDKGAHSHLRINNEEKYDAAIKEFLSR